MDLPSDWVALIALVFVFGAKHGLDPDHLATIDGLTRYNLREAPARAPWCGSLFSLGHGSIVMLIALGVAMVSHRWQVPPWMDHVGTLVSVSFLTFLGLLNLRAVLMASPDTLVAPIGLKAGLLSRVQSASHPLAIAGVGALFALSFDTMTQAALFAVTASQHGGLMYALIMGLAFTTGMLAMDGVNGLWIARLLRKSDRRARAASRVMGLMVAIISLAVAALGLARWLRSDVATWYDGKEVVLGVSVMVLLAVTFLASQMLVRTVVPAPVRR